MLNQLMYVAIVDPIVSGAYVAESLRENHIKTIAIFTLTGLTDEEKRARFFPERYDHVFFLSDYSNLHALAAALKTFSIDILLYGSEKSVEIADNLNMALGLNYGNNPKTAAYRYDKYEMVECIAKAGLSVTKQMKLTPKDLDTSKCHALKKFEFPAVIKPLNAGGSSGVTLINSFDELTRYFGTAPTCYTGTPITDFVLQSQLLGKEYVVNTFSINGEHQVVSVFSYHKEIINGSPVYRYTDIVKQDMPEYQEASAYVLQVLTTVGLNNGFSHTEIFLTKDGPRLVEVNPRIAGGSGMLDKLSKAVLGNNQVDALVYFLHHKQLDHRLHVSNLHGRIILLQNWRSRVIGSLATDKIKSLASYFDCKVLQPAGTYIQTAKALSSTVAMVLLVHANEKQIQKDSDQIFAWEQAELLF